MDFAYFILFFLAKIFLGPCASQFVWWVLVYVKKIYIPEYQLIDA